MSVCSATAAASARPRGRPSRSASSGHAGRASITEQLMMITERAEKNTEKRYDFLDTVKAAPHKCAIRTGQP